MMSEQKDAAFLGVMLFFLLTLVILFQDSDTGFISLSVLIGSVAFGILLLFFLTKKAETKWLKILAKAAFILPLTPLVILLFQEMFKGGYVQYSSPNMLTYLLYELILLLVIVLFIFTDKYKDGLIRLLAWIIGLIIYFIIGVLGAFIITPPSFGTYGTPLYKPKTK